MSYEAHLDFVVIIYCYVVVVNSFFIFLLTLWGFGAILMVYIILKGVIYMNKRIKQLRKELHLSQADFGSKVGVKGNTIGNYEVGLRNPSDAVIFSICREFNVNEEWLRNGTGEMFNSLSQDEELAYIVGHALPNADVFVKNTFVALGRLSQEFTADDWKVIKRFVDALAGKDK